MLVLLPAYQYVAAVAGAEAAAQIDSHMLLRGDPPRSPLVSSVDDCGMAAVRPLGGIDVHALGGLWSPFVLINLGCTLRVTMQTLTDFTPAAFPIAGASGILELTGLAIWGAHLWRLMSPQAAILNDQTSASGAELTPTQPIMAEHRVGDVLAQYPRLLDIFVTFGFTPLRNPLLRKTLARRVTIAQACHMMDVDIHELLRTLNEHRATNIDGKVAHAATRDLSGRIRIGTTTERRSMKPVFILRNVSHETAGSLESYLAEAGMERYFDLFRETPRQLPLTRPPRYQMGGPMSVHDVGQHPFLTAEILDSAGRRATVANAGDLPWLATVGQGDGGKGLSQQSQRNRLVSDRNAALSGRRLTLCRLQQYGDGLPVARRHL